MMSRISEFSKLSKLQTSVILPSNGSYCSEAATAADIDEAATAADTHISIAPDEHLRGHPSALTVEVTSVAPDEHLHGHPSASMVDTFNFYTRIIFLGRAPTRASDIFID